MNLTKPAGYRTMNVTKLTTNSTKPARYRTVSYG